MSGLRLRLRTPQGVQLDRPVRRVTAEDHSGWFGIWPRREDLIAALPPGLLVFEDEEGEAFVALSGGLLDLRGDTCHVLVGRAQVSRDLDAIAEEVGHQAARRRASAELHRGVVGELAREAVRRLVQERR